MSRQISAKKKRVQYSPENMALAIDMVRKGLMSKKQASCTYGVPRTTLLDKLAGRVPEEPTRPGPMPVLTQAEEDVVVNYCKLMTEIGYPLTRKELKFEVKKVLDSDGRKIPFKDNLPGKDWFKAFVSRHPDLTERAPMSLGHERAIISDDMIKGWFNGVFTFLQKEVPDWQALVKDPRRIFNADESGFPLCITSGKVLAPKGARHVYHIVPNNKTQITVMVCFNAFGEYVPPVIVYPGQRFRDVGINGFPEAIYGHTDSGWMDSDLFVEFLSHLKQFAEEKQITFPILLFVDGHSTHMSLQAAEFCRDNKIILYCFLPNATHILQPCDVGLFSPMKKAWSNAVKSWQMEHLGESITKKCFPEIFKKAWVSVTTLENAVHGFRRCGLFPLTPNGIDATKLGPSKLISSTSSSQVHLKPASSVMPSSSASNLVDSVPTDTNAVMSNVESSVNISAPESDVVLPPVLQPNNVAERPSSGDNSMATTSSPTHQKPSTSSETPSIKVSSSGRVLNFPSPLPSSTQNSESLKVALFSRKDIVNKDRKSPFHVSKSFENLRVPEIKSKRPVNNIRNKLPKAISGSLAIQMLKEREENRKAEEEAKIKRKEEREQKKKARDEEKEKKRQERIKRKQEQEAKKGAKEQGKGGRKNLKRRHKEPESSEEENEENIPYRDSDDSLSSFEEGCPGCGLITGSKKDWVGCNKCPTWWHKWCTGDDAIVEMSFEELSTVPFCCMLCE